MTLEKVSLSVSLQSICQYINLVTKDTLAYVSLWQVALIFWRTTAQLAL